MKVRQHSATNLYKLKKKKNLQCWHITNIGNYFNTLYCHHFCSILTRFAPPKKEVSLSHFPLPPEAVVKGG